MSASSSSSSGGDAGLVLSYTQLDNAYIALVGVGLCAEAKINVTLKEDKKQERPVMLTLADGKTRFFGNSLALRYLARVAQGVSSPVFGTDALSATQVDFFVELAERELHRKERLPELLGFLNEHLAFRSFLVGYR